jgi:electron transport complex protein RnfG
MNKVAHLTVFLSVISAIAGGALAWANNMTAPVIAANNLKQEKESLQEMYPDASLNDF